MTTKIKAPPVRGVAKWLPDCPVMGCWRLRISSEVNRQVHRQRSNILKVTADLVSRDYDVEESPTGFILYYLNDRFQLVSYSVDTRGSRWLCSCPDSKYRDRACKHVNALRAALSKREKK